MLSTLTQMEFTVLTVIFYYLLHREFKLALPKTTLSATSQKRFLNTFVIVLVVWAFLVSTLSIIGVFVNFDLFPLNVGPFLFIPLITIIIFTFSKTLSEVLKHIHPN